MNTPVYRIMSDAAELHGVPNDVQFMCGFPEYETVTVNDGDEQNPHYRTYTQPTGKYVFYFQSHPSMDSGGFASAMRDAVRRDAESADNESRSLLRHLTSQQ